MEFSYDGIIATPLAWLEQNAKKVMKGGKLSTAINYSLNQWQYLIGYCERGDLMIRGLVNIGLFSETIL